MMLVIIVFLFASQWPVSIFAQDAQTFSMSFPASGKSGASVPSAIIVQNSEFSIVPAKGFSELCPLLVQINEEKALNMEERIQNIREGEAPLRWLAWPFHKAERTTSSVVYKAPLMLAYRQCKAIGWLSLTNGIRIPRHKSHILLNFANGTLTFSIDLSRKEKGAILVSERTNIAGAPEWKWKGKLNEN
jgi:hypothetical protein